MSWEANGSSSRERNFLSFVVSCLLNWWKCIQNFYFIHFSFILFWWACASEACGIACVKLLPHFSGNALGAEWVLNCNINFTEISVSGFYAAAFVAVCIFTVRKHFLIWCEGWKVWLSHISGRVERESLCAPFFGPRIAIPVGRQRKGWAEWNVKWMSKYFLYVKSDHNRQTYGSFIFVAY